MDTSKGQPLWKVMGYLRGVAILFVLVSHCGWFTMLYYQQLVTRGLLGTDPAILPNVEFNLGSMIILQEFARCAVPIFIFLTGHFLAATPHTFKAIRGRSVHLICAYLFWSLCAWFSVCLLHQGETFLECARGIILKPGGLLLKLAIGEAQMGFYFILVILQFFILARWVVPLMRHRPRLVLTLGFLLQLASMVINYYDMLSAPWLQQSFNVPGFFFSRWSFFFALGVWAGVNPRATKQVLDRRKTIFCFTLVSAILLVTESRLALELFQQKYFDIILNANVLQPMVDWKLGTILWSVGLVLGGLALGRTWLPESKSIVKLGSRAITIFLVHAQVLILVQYAVVDTDWFRQLQLYWWVVLPCLIMICLAIPILMAVIFRRYFPILGKYIMGS